VLLRPIVEQVGGDPPRIDTARVGEPAGLLKRDLGEVDAGHAPALLRQPDRVAALAAGEIERGSRSKSGRLGHEEAVRLARPEQLAAAIAAVPLNAVHRSKHAYATEAAARTRRTSRRRIATASRSPAHRLARPLRNHTTSRRADNHQDVLISVRVDTDHVIHLICKHPDRSSGFTRRVR